MCCGRVERQVPECDEGNEDGGRSFDDEEVPPWLERTAVDLENTEGEESGECTGDGLSGVEDCEPAGEFASAVEPGVSSADERNREYRGKNLHSLVVNDEREESRFAHPQEPTDSHQSAKVLDRNHHQRAGSETTHHARQDSTRSILLS
jgi:hypothetical protein